jgi:hypothetical protein
MGAFLPRIEFAVRDPVEANGFAGFGASVSTPGARATSVSLSPEFGACLPTLKKVETLAKTSLLLQGPKSLKTINHPLARILAKNHDL